VKNTFVILLTVLAVFSKSSIFAQLPSTAAPVPPLRSATKVISIFSDSYTNVTGTIFTPYWNQSTVVTTFTIGGNPAMKYLNFNWQGIELGSVINALPMTHLHIDVWTANETAMQITPISRTTPEVSFKLVPLVLNSWNSFDIPLTEFSNKGLSIADIIQFKLAGAGGHTVFIDNLYFYNDMAGEDTYGPLDFTATSGLVTFNSIELNLNAIDSSGAVFYEIVSGDSTVFLSNASGTQKSYTFKPLNVATVYNFSVTAKDYAGNLALNNPIALTITTNDSPAPAPTPPARAAHKVISIFSDAYTGISGITSFFPYWKQLTLASFTDFQGDPVLKYDNLNYQGIELGSDINALPMTHLHVDVWTPNETSLQISTVSRSKTNSNVALAPLVLNTWNSFDIPLADITGKWLSVSDIFQFSFTGAGGNTVYIDNLYFYNNSLIEDADAPTAFTALKGVVTFNSVELLLKASDNSGAVIYDIKYGAKTVIANGITGKSTSVTINSLSGGTAYNFSVTVKDPTGNTAANNPIVVSASTLVATNAPTPTTKPGDVISIFSDAYSNVPGTNFNPYWNQTTTVSTIKISSNNVLSYSNFNYQGTEFGSHLDVTQMTHLHVDAWTANEISLQVSIISPGKEKLVALLPLTKNVWNSFDVPLTSFTGVNLTDVFQFKFVGSGGKTVLLDNLYFYKSVPNDIPKPEFTDNLKIYPNPLIRFLIVASDKNISEVNIYNISGKALKNLQVNDLKTTIDLGMLPAGSYFVSVKNSKGELSVQKVIKF
jgi:hypothetical protein